MTEGKRFSKTITLSVLRARVARIAKNEEFDRKNGTSQLRVNGIDLKTQDELIRRAVEYGRMMAFQEFHEAIEDGFQFEPNASS